MNSHANLEWESAVGFILRKEKQLRAGEISTIKDKGTGRHLKENKMNTCEVGRKGGANCWIYIIIKF